MAEKTLEVLNVKVWDSQNGRSFSRGNQEDFVVFSEMNNISFKWKPHCFHGQVYSCYQVIQLCKESGVFISGVLHDSNSFITIVVEGDGRGNGVHGSLFQDRSHLLRFQS